MSTITKEFTKEQLQQIIETDHVQCGEASSLARVALASLEAEAVHQVYGNSDDTWSDVDEDEMIRLSSDGEDTRTLYTAPPAPASVPDEVSWEDVPEEITEYDMALASAWAHGFNQCRAAMLQSGNFRENKNSSTNNFREIAETSTNYPVIPSEVLSAILKVAKIRADFDDFDGDRRGIGDCLDEAEQELIVTINKYASQLAAEPIATNDVREQTAVPPVPVIQADVAQAIEKLKRKLVECNRYNYCADAVKGVEYACHAAMLQGADGTLTNEGTMQLSGNSEQIEPVSNRDELPLDYLQGHKDGLEWAAQLAEANHPQTGDWLYDDPIDLARAIRKGPDMPTVQGGNSPVIPDDVRRMDWLVSKTVDVREPMVYGSHSLFWSQTITDEEDDYHATKLREQIDAAMAAEQAAAPQQEAE